MCRAFEPKPEPQPPFWIIQFKQWTFQVYPHKSFEQYAAGMVLWLWVKEDVVVICDNLLALIHNEWIWIWIYVYASTNVSYHLVREAYIKYRSRCAHAKTFFRTLRSSHLTHNRHCNDNRFSCLLMNECRCHAYHFIWAPRTQRSLHFIYNFKKMRVCCLY